MLDATLSAHSYLHEPAGCKFAYEVGVFLLRAAHLLIRVRIPHLAVHVSCIIKCCSCGLGKRSSGITAGLGGWALDSPQMAGLASHGYSDLDQNVHCNPALFHIWGLLSWISLVISSGGWFAATAQVAKCGSRTETSTSRRAGRNN